MGIECSPGCEGKLSPLLYAWNYCPECGTPWKKDLEERPKRVGDWGILHICSNCGRSKTNYFSFTCGKAGKHMDGLFDLDCSGWMKEKGEWKYCPHCGQEKAESEEIARQINERRQK